MFSSEQTFTINGHNDRELEIALKFMLEFSGAKVKAFYKDLKGLVLCRWECDSSTSYPFEATVPILIEQINQYIGGLSKDEILRLAGSRPDNDGSVYLGWEIFHPLWYGDDCLQKYEQSSLIAIRPKWIVFGK